MLKTLTTILWTLVLFALPLLVSETSSKERTNYFVFFAIFAPIFALALYGFGKRLGPLTAEAKYRNAPKVNLMFSWMFLIYLLGLIAISYLELLNSKAIIAVVRTIDFFEQWTPLLKKYEIYYSLTGPPSIHLLKTQTSSALSFWFGLTIALTFLFLHFRLAPEIRAEIFREVKGDKPYTTTMFFGTLVLTAMVIYQVLSGSMEFDSTMSRRQPCFTSLQCYSHSSFQILLAAIWKLILHFVPVGMILITDQSLLITRGYSTSSSRKR